MARATGKENCPAEIRGTGNRVYLVNTSIPPILYRTTHRPSIYRPDYRESTLISSRPSSLMTREKVKPTVYITFQPVDVTLRSFPSLSRLRLLRNGVVGSSRGLWDDGKLEGERNGSSDD